SFVEQLGQRTRAGAIPLLAATGIEPEADQTELAEERAVDDLMPALAGAQPAAVGAADLLRDELGHLVGDHGLLHAAEQILGLGECQAETLRLQRAALELGDFLNHGRFVGVGLDDHLNPYAHGWPLLRWSAARGSSSRGSYRDRIGVRMMALPRTFCRR